MRVMRLVFEKKKTYFFQMIYSCKKLFCFKIWSFFSVFFFSIFFLDAFILLLAKSCLSLIMT